MRSDLRNRNGHSGFVLGLGRCQFLGELHRSPAEPQRATEQSLRLAVLVVVRAEVSQASRCGVRTQHPTRASAGTRASSSIATQSGAPPRTTFAGGSVKSEPPLAELTERPEALVVDLGLVQRIGERTELVGERLAARTGAGEGRAQHLLNALGRAGHSILP